MDDIVALAKKRIVQECIKNKIDKVEAIQYVLATVEHETGGKFTPVTESWWLNDSDKYLRTNPITKRYYPYYGRGLVQITWRDNYEKFGKLMGIDLVANPDLALDFNNALFILIHGMKHGIFTGKKLSDFFNKNGSDFIGARAIVNGKDQDTKIAKMAQEIKVDTDFFVGMKNDDL